MTPRKEELLKKLDTAIVFSLCALIFTLPISKSMVESFFGLALALWAAKRVFAYSGTSSLLAVFKPIPTCLNTPLAVFMVFGFLSTLTSTYPVLSLEGFFFKLFQGVALYLIIVETIGTKKRLNIVFIVMALSAALVAADVTFQYMTGKDFLRNFSSTAGCIVRGPFGNENSLAAWLLIVIPLLYSLACFWGNDKTGFFNGGRRIRILIKIVSYALTAILIAALIFTYSRGAWLAFLLSLIFLGIFGTRKLLIVLIIVLLILPYAASGLVKDHLVSIMKPDMAHVDRFILWREALSIFGDFPVLGCGLNTYATVAPLYRITPETGFYPHNSYLHMAAEMGILGLGAFIWIMIRLFKSALISIRKTQPFAYQAVMVGLLTGLFGFLAHSFVDNNLYALQLSNLLWFMMGLVVAAEKIFYHTP